MKTTSLTGRALLAFLSAQLALGPQAVHAQAAPDAADNRTNVTQSANGTPVVNIATPNAAGVSHNRFNSYDVSSQGLILNNSSVNAISLLGGGTAANANLLGSSAASLILNEVIAPNAGSQLAGYQEILGASAELVIANPWGITCNGCGFVNTPRVTLTTGVPMLGGGGALAGFTITGGQISIGASGLDATRQSVLDLLAHRISVGGEVIVGSDSNAISGDLQLLGGANRFDYANRTGTAIAGVGAGAVFAIDSSALGGMYADRIRLLVNGHGSGVRVAGNLAALADDLVIRANGRIELRAAASAQRDFVVDGADVQIQLADSNTYVYGGRDLNLHATGALGLGSGSIGALRNTSLQAASLLDTGGANDVRFATQGEIDATLSGALDLSGGYWTASRLAFNAGSATLHGGAVLYASGANGTALNLVTSGLLSLADAGIYSEADAVLDVQRLELDSNAEIAAAETLSATVTRGDAGGIDNSGVLQGASVSLLAAGEAAANPTTFHNAASGAILAGNSLSIAESGAGSAGSALVNEGIVSGGTVSIETSDTINRNGTLQAQESLQLRSATLENTGRDALIVASGNATGGGMIAAGTLTNSGTIWSAGDLTVNTTSLTQSRAVGVSSNPLIGAGRDLTLAYSGEATLGTGDLQAGRDLTISATQVNDRGATGVGADLRYAGRNLSATAAPGGAVSIGGGQWYSDGDLRLSGDDVIIGSYFDPQLGTTVFASGEQIIAGQGGSGVLALTARNGAVSLTSDASVFSGGDLSITQSSAFVLNQQNVLQADGLLSIAAGGSIENYGTLIGGTAELASNSGTPLLFRNRSTGVLVANEALRIGTPAARAGTVLIDAAAPGSQAGVYGGVLDIHTAGLFNFGALQGVGPGSIIQTDQLVNNESGTIKGFADGAGRGGLTINAAAAITNFGLLYDSSDLTLNTRTLTNVANGSTVGTIGSAGLLTINSGASGAPQDFNQGQIWGDTLDLTFAGGLVNGRDPGQPQNRSQTASIFANSSLTINILNGATLTNYGTLESAGDLALHYLGGGAGSVANEMGMVPQSELVWITDTVNPVIQFGDLGQLASGANGSTDKRHVTVGDTTFYWFDQIGGSFDAYLDTRQTNVQNQQLAIDRATIPTPTIRAGGDLEILGFEVVRNNGTIEAAGDATIRSTSPTSTVQNTSLQFGQRNIVTSSTTSYTCRFNAGASNHPTSCGASPNNITRNGLHQQNSIVTPIVPGRTAFAGRIYAGGNLDVTAGSVVNSGTPGPFTITLPGGPAQTGAISVTEPGTPGARAGATTLNVNGAQIPLPTSPNGRFVGDQNSATGPLVETNPLFGIDSIGLGSGYLANLLGLSSEAQMRRLGDDNYEAYLIEQQVKAATGRSVLHNYYGADDMVKALYDNAAAEAQALNLGYGKALTAQQIASLKSDIVWLVEQEVQGQKVLVPVVYLTDATRALANSGAGPTLAGYNVNINAGSVTNTGGEIAAANLVNVKTSGDIQNLSGRISGWNVQLNAGGDIVNSTLTTRLGDAANGIDVAQRTASVEAGNTAVLRAARDINVNGAFVSAAKDAVLIAGKNVNVQSLALTTNSHTQAGGNFTTSQTQTATSAGIVAGANAIVQAGRDVNLVGAAVSAGDTASLRAETGNVNVAAFELKNSNSSTTTTTGLYTDFQVDKPNAAITAGFGIENKTSSQTTTTTTGAGSAIAGNRVVVSTGKGDVNLTGSSIDAGTGGALIDSARDVNIAAYNDTTESTTSTDTLRVGTQVDATADGVHYGAKQSGEKTSTTTKQTTARTSSVSSGGSLVIKGKGNVTNEGTRLDAAGDILLSGENVINRAAQDTYTTTTTDSKWETKQQAGLTTNGTGASINDVAQGKGNQVTVNNLELQQRVTGSYTTDTTTDSQTKARGTQINSGGNVVVVARNNASDEGTQYDAAKNIVISAESYENRAAADTRTTTAESTYASGQATVGVNSSAEAVLTASGQGGHETSSSGQSTARVGAIKAGGAVVIEGRGGDVTLEGTQIDGQKGVGINAARDLNIKQANDTTTRSSAEESGSGRLSGSVSLLGTGGSVGVGASTRLATSEEATSKARTASIKSGDGDVQLDAGRDLTSQGTKVDAAGNVDLKAGRDVNLLAAIDKLDKTGSVDAGGGDVNVGFGTGAAKGNGGVGASVNFEQGRTDYHESIERGSDIKAGGNFTLDAGGNARLQGTQVDAAGATLKTGGDLLLESAQRTVKDDSHNVSGQFDVAGSKGGGVGGAAGVSHGTSGTAGGGKGGNAAGGNAQVDVVKSKQDIVTNSNAAINTRGGTTLDIGGDLSLKGANVNAQGGVSGQVAGNLNIETRIDKEIVDTTDVKTYAGTAPIGGSGGGSKFQRGQEAVQAGANNVAQTGIFADVDAQKKNNATVGTASGISGGSSGVDLRVAGNTTLKGAANTGSDFDTQGQTTIESVETQTSGSSTTFRAAGTVASAAGSDKGKGGDFGLNVASGRRRTSNADNAPRRESAASPDVVQPAARPRANTGSVNEPASPRALVNPQKPAGAAQDPSTATRANRPVDRTQPVTRPGPQDQSTEVYGNRPVDTTQPITRPAPQDQSTVVYGNRPVDSTQPVTRPAPQDQSTVVYGNRPVDQTQPITRPAPQNPPRDVYETGSTAGAQTAAQRNGTQVASVSARNPVRGANDDSLNVPTGQAPRVVQPQPDQHAWTEATQRAVSTLLDRNSDVRALRDAGQNLQANDRKAFERNLAEIESFTGESFGASQRQQLLGALNTSLQGPRVRADGVTEFPLLPQYVGEDVRGFDNWYTRRANKREKDVPGGQYASGRLPIGTDGVGYFSPEEQSQRRVSLQDGQLTRQGAPLPDGKWIFVVDQAGHLVADKPRGGFIHHSSLSGGKPILTAGEFEIRGGQLTTISNQSGHFRPSTQSFEHFLVELGDRGVNLNGVKGEAVVLQTDADGRFSQQEVKNLLEHPELLRRGRGAMLAPSPPAWSRPGDADVQPIGWELPPRFRNLGGLPWSEAADAGLRMAA